jgi:translation initiation factor eIF-2B subunit epsilon
MPSKENAKKSGATTKQKTLNAGGDDMRREAKLQAILLADSFSKCFRPLTHTTPKVLLPLVNVPMIEYTIEFLAANGVEELFVFCVWHAPAIQEYLSKSKWNKLLTIKCITSNACLSAGEALREIDSMGIVRSDPFILISGDVVSNMDLKKAIQFHKDKRKEDNNAIMTVVLKKVHYQAHVKPIHDDLVVAMDAKTDQLLLFENAMHDNSLNIPQEIIVDHPALKFHADLLDCHIDVCSPGIPVSHPLCVLLTLTSHSYYRATFTI